MKKRIRRGDPGKQAHWHAVVRRWRESGRSVRAYRRAEGLPGRRLDQVRIDAGQHGAELGRGLSHQGPIVADPRLPGLARADGSILFPNVRLIGAICGRRSGLARPVR